MTPVFFRPLAQLTRWLGFVVAASCVLLPAARAEPELNVVVDARVELAAVLCRLAGYAEFQARGIERYDQLVDRHFSRFAEHEAVKLTRELRASHRIGFNATVGLALAAQSAHIGTPSIALDPLPAFIDPRWTPQVAQRWLRMAEEFAKDSEFDAFLAAVKPIHDEAVTALRDELRRHFDLPWLRQFVAGNAAAEVPASFTVVLGLLHGQNSYGPQVRRADGYTEFFAVLATPPMPEGSTIRYPIGSSVALIVHEFARSYVNPWVDRHAEELDDAAARLFATVEGQMRGAHYGAPRILLYESLVRAVTHNYLRTHGLGRSSFVQWQAQDRAQGFYWVEPLTELLRAGPRDQSALDRNRARIVGFFNDWGREADRRVADVKQAVEAAKPVPPLLLAGTGPQIVRVTPAHDDANVNPGLTEIEIEFDRPMGEGYSFVYGPRPLPRFIGQPQWDASKRVLKQRVKLDPATEYGVYMNNGKFTNFASEEGMPLKPRAWLFQTAPK